MLAPNLANSGSWSGQIDELDAIRAGHMVSENVCTMTSGNRSTVIICRCVMRFQCPCPLFSQCYELLHKHARVLTTGNLWMKNKPY